MKDYQNLLNGKWIGNWGRRKNVTVTINTIGSTTTGSYKIDSQLIPFSGTFKLRNNEMLIKFNPPMEAESGGKLDLETNKLYLYCTSTSGFFTKASS